MPESELQADDRRERQYLWPGDRPGRQAQQRVRHQRRKVREHPPWADAVPAVRHPQERRQPERPRGLRERQDHQQAWSEV